MPPNEPSPGALLGGKIRLTKRIGRGGMGDVWAARNEATEAEVAVKTLHRTERTPEHDERFRREARLSATISHRNVVRVFDLVDEPDGTLGLVMELLRGATLEALLKQRGRLSATQAVALAAPVLSAMHHVHQKGVVHRDMKPANVFLAVEPDGHVIVKVLDFGIAKLPAASSLTMDDKVLGTPHYMSPEQIRGVCDIDGRSDMFSFAGVLYELLTGVPGFRRDLAAASLAAVLEHELEPHPDIPERLWAALSRALAKQPAERYASCAELSEALRAAVDATEEDLTQALQELRPCAEEPEPTTGELSFPPSATSRPAPVRRLGSARTWLLAGVGAVAAAAMVAAATAPRRGEAGRGAEAAPDGAPSAQPAARVARPPEPAAPPPDPSPPPGEEGGPPEAGAPRAAGGRASDALAPGAAPAPEASASERAEAPPRATETAPSRAAPPSPPKARQRAKTIATTPGF